MALRSKISIGLALSLIFATDGISQPSQSTEREGPSIRFEGYFERLGWGAHTGAAASMAYEIVRSHKVRSVQWTYKWLDGNSAPAIPRAITFDLYEINDFAVCASLQPLTSVEYTSDAARMDFSPKLFDVSNFDHELIQGRCVAAKQAKEIAASHIVLMGGIGKIVVVTGDREVDFPYNNHYAPLAALSITLTGSGYDLWSKDGMTRSLDPLTDAELVRAIKSSESLRRASLRILQNRHQERFDTRECAFARSPLLKPTGSDVVRAILDSKVLSEGDSQLRLQTMRALAAIRPASYHSELVEQLLSGLERPIEDSRSPAVLERQRRVETLIGKELAARPEGQAAYRNSLHFEAASAVALLAGKDVVEPLAAHFKNHLKDQIGRSSYQPCTDELVASASYGSDIFMEIVKKVDALGIAIPAFYMRIESMAAIAAQNSPPIRAMIAARCSRAEGFYPNGSRAVSSAICRASTK